MPAWLLLAALVIALTTFLSSCGSSARTAETQDDRPLMSTLDGQTVSLEDYKGKPVFLAFMEST
jgi:hypothetical protein